MWLGETATRADKSANFPHELLLAKIQVSRLHKVYANGLSVNIKLFKTQLSKMIKLGEFSPLHRLSLT